MNILNVITSAAGALEQGKSFKLSTVLSNTEAGAAMVYGVLSALFVLLKAFGVDIPVDSDQINTIANGWTATASVVYSLYRIATNPAAGVKVP